MALGEYGVSTGKHARAPLGADNETRYRATLLFDCGLDPELLDVSHVVNRTIQEASIFHQYVTVSGSL